MSVTRDGGMPAYNAASASGFVPEIFSGKMVEKTYLSTCFAEISNTDYEGEIKNQGDKVIIRTTPDITIRPYTVGGGITFDRPTSEKVELEIDQAFQFGFELMNVDEVQSDLKLMDDWSTNAGKNMGIEIDRNVLAYAYTQVSATNAGIAAGAISGGYNMGTTGAPVELTKANIIDVLVDCGSVLWEENIPMDGRYFVIPTWAANLIKKSDLKDASLSGDGTSMLRNGRLGMIDNTTIYVSNNISHVTDGAAKVANIIFGHKKALTFAAQISKMENKEHPTDFGKRLCGLNVFGRQVIDPKAIGHLYAYKGA